MRNKIQVAICIVLGLCLVSMLGMCALALDEFADGQNQRAKIEKKASDQ